MIKHKHKWNFVKEIGAYYSPGVKTENVDIPSAWFPPMYKFVCLCGKTKIVSEKQNDK